MNSATAVDFNATSSAHTDSSRRHTILAEKIARGRATAASVMERVFTEIPADAVVKSGDIAWMRRELPAAAGTAAPQYLAAVIDNRAYKVSDHALSQVAERVGVPYAYLSQLARGAQPWQTDLAAHLLSEHHDHRDSERRLVRSVKGVIRGYLSDKYRRLDSRPLVDALAQEAQALGAVPVDGVVTETRAALKVIMPEPIEVRPGEWVALGAEWSNSDFGNGTHSLRGFVIRVACLNGMTTENSLRQVHVGAKLSDDFEFSARTMRLDTETSVSALRDVVRGVLGPAGADKLRARVAAASDKEVGKAPLERRVKELPKATQKLVVDAFESEDVINLPEGKNAWRASNAISWVARNCEDAEQRLDLERLAGEASS